MKKKKAMVMMTNRFTKEQKRMIEKVAKLKDVSENEIVRRSVQNYLINLI